MSSNQADLSMVLAYEAGREHEHALTKTKFSVKPGDIFRDKDPRMEGRHLKVVSADSRHAYVINCAADGALVTGRKTRVSLRGLETRFERVGGSCQREDLERGALSALIEWRAADLAVLECLKVPREERAGKWDEAHTDAVNRRIAAIEALRAAADEVTEKKHENH